MNKLPFLKERAPATLRKLSGVSKYGFSEDDELIESTLDELMAAIHEKNPQNLIQALKALIEIISNKEESNGTDVQEAT